MVGPDGETIHGLSCRDEDSEDLVCECVRGNTPCLSCRPPSFAHGILPFPGVGPSCSNLVVGVFDFEDTVGVRSVNTQTSSRDGIVLDAPAASCAAEFVRPPSSNGCIKFS